MPLYFFMYGVANTGVHNLSSKSLTPSQQLTLGMGLKFVPPPPLCTRDDVAASVDNLTRQVRLRYMFMGHDSKKADPLRLPNPAFQPTKAHWSYEQYLLGCKGKLLDVFDSSLVRFSGLPKAMALSIRTLRDNDFIIIKPADKNLGTAVVNTSWYIQEAKRQLEDRSVYTPISNSNELVSRAYAGLRKILAKFKELFQFDKKGNRVGLTKLAQFLLQHQKGVGTALKDTRISQFYLIVKLHKNPVAGRPIVSSCESCTYAAAQWIDRELQPLMKQQRSYIQDSATLLHKLETTTFPPDITILTADVESLYPSITLSDAMRRIQQLLHRTKGWGRSPRTAFLLSVLHWVLHNNIFHFGDTSWLQVRGTAMGSPAAVVFANLYLACLENELFASMTEPPPLVYNRFIDDIFAIVKGDLSKAKALVYEFNSIHETINLTHEAGDTVPFLDLMIFKGPRFKRTGILDVALHQKELNMYLYIPPTSFHAIHVFRSFIISELKRFCINTCSTERFNAIKDLFYYRLRRRGYSPGFLKTTLATVSHADRPLLLERLAKRLHEQTSNVDNESTAPLVLKVKYDQRMRKSRLGPCLDLPQYLKDQQHFNQVFTTGKPTLCWTTGCALKNLLCPTKFKHSVKEHFDLATDSD